MARGWEKWGRTGIETASMISLIIWGSDIRATPPSRRMSEGTRSRAWREGNQNRLRVNEGNPGALTHHNGASSSSLGEDGLLDVDDVHCERGRASVSDWPIPIRFRFSRNPSNRLIALLVAAEH